MPNMSATTIQHLIPQLSSQADEALRVGDVDGCKALIEKIYAAIDALAQLPQSLDKPKSFLVDNTYRPSYSIYRHFPALRPLGDAFF